MEYWGAIAGGLSEVAAIIMIVANEIAIRRMGRK